MHFVYFHLCCFVSSAFFSPSSYTHQCVRNSFVFRFSYFFRSSFSLQISCWIGHTRLSCPWNAKFHQRSHQRSHEAQRERHENHSGYVLILLTTFPYASTFFLGNFNEHWARLIFCEAHKLEMFGRRYQWIIMGTYSNEWWRKLEPDSNCTVDDLETVLEQTILTDLLPLSTSGEITISGIVSLLFFRYSFVLVICFILRPLKNTKRNTIRDEETNTRGFTVTPTTVFGP